MFGHVMPNAKRLPLAEASTRGPGAQPARGPHNVPAIEPNSRGTLSRIAARYAAARHIDTGPLKVQAGLPPNLEDDPDIMIDVAGQIAFLNFIAAALGDDLFGFHLALAYDVRELGPFYYIMASASTVGEALRREERYTALVSEGIRVRCRFGDKLVVDTEYEGVDRHLDRHQIEFWITCTVRKLRELSGRKIVPSETVWMHHRGGREASEIQAYLGGKVSFDGGRDRLEFSKDIAEVQFPSADKHLDSFLLGYADAAIASQPAPAKSLRTQVENAIAPRLPHGTASQSPVAASLGLSSRTLARRLQEEGMTFREILEDMRFDLATQYLQNQRLSVAQIAWLLGYATPNTFARAFRSRTGKPPRRGR